jgi:hypothetical protein
VTSGPGRRDGGYTPLMRRLVAALLLVTTGLALAGCQRSLFPKNAPRTQYETYDRMRNRYTPLEEMDVFGQPRPALRARLSPQTLQ